ncbi:hypothetical protein FRC03_009740 [Tulasnella sp. 419]|nr:hypothetical protein FRC03_009740 [Tulasnella sp. 419]
MSTTAATILPQGAGYGVVVGIGLFFSGLMLLLTAIQKRYTPFSPSNAEEFSSASRSVKPGLIAAGIVSAWTWAATLLQSSAVAYRYGISGPYWYAAGATVQVLLFAQLAAKLKLNAPNVHTFLEIIAARWGTVAHVIFLFFGLATNVLVSAMLTLGGSATVTDLTGMSTVAACFLIPLGVSIYVVAGGMRATLLCDYTHTAVLFVIIMVFVFTVYATSPKIGSPARMHELLSNLTASHPVEDNAGGSYLTMRSVGGIIFGIINLVGNFATVFNDQAYWQRAIASQPASSVKAFLLGGLAWFSIPFLFATTLGLAAQLIAVSSILTYDIYKRYINPNATEAQILRVSHYMIVAFALFMGCIGTAFYYIGLSMGWLYLFMGTVLGSAVVPIALCITWRRASKIGCVSGAVLGLIFGLIAWLVTTACLNDNVITVVTSGGDYEMLAGNLVAIGVGGIVAVVVSYLKPDNEFDFAITRAINSGTIEHSEQVDVGEDSDEKGSVKEKVEVARVVEKHVGITEDKDLDPVQLKKAFKFAVWSSVALFVLLILIIPLPLFFSQVVYGVKGFTTWVSVGIIWVFLAAFTVVLYPIWESREALVMVTKGVTKDIFSFGGGKFVNPSTNAA